MPVINIIANSNAFNQDQKRAAAVVSPPSPILPSSSINPDQFVSNSRANPSIPSRPIVTAPQPLRALDRRPSTSNQTGRNRSPSSSTAFSDLAHQGTKVKWTVSAQ